jgi:hypothetical protein
MSIYVLKNNQRTGPFDDSAVADSLKSGALSPGDLACREGMNEWRPLRTLMNNRNDTQTTVSTSRSTVSTRNVPASRSRVTVPLVMALIGLIVLGCIGVAVGGFVGFLLRPEAPLVGQLPLETVLTRGANLRGFDSLLMGVAQTSFNYLITGVILGGFVGGICGVFGGLLAGLLFSRR